MNDNENSRPLRAQELEDEKAVRSIPLDTDDGGTVVIEQQNMGGAQQVGGGEYKNVGAGRTVDQAPAEQALLEREAPIGTGASDADGVADRDGAESSSATRDPSEDAAEDDES